MCNRYFLIIISILLLCSCGAKETTVESRTPIPTATQTAKATENSVITPIVKETKATPKPTSKPTARTEPKEEQTQTPPTSTPIAQKQVEEKKPQNVTVSIMDADKQTILAETEIEFKDGMTAFDALKTATSGKIDVKASGFGAFVYVQGIGKLFEFDKGPISGWLYFVNGNKPDVGAGSCKIKVGDNVAWKYTIDGQK